MIVLEKLYIKKKKEMRTISNQKYEITDMAHEEYPFLHRIRALRDICGEIRAGDIGGFVESESNLSAEPGDCAWIFDDAIAAGDAYVDHPSFGAAVIVRTLEAAGYHVAVLAQPNWKNANDFKRFGRPNYGFLVSSGVIDSMVNHYTAAKRRRSEDFYSPGKRSGCRPDRAAIVYCNRAREAWFGMPRGQQLARSGHDFYPPEVAARHDEQEYEVLRSGVALDIAEEESWGDAGRVRYTRTRKIAIRDASGQPDALMVISEDVTPQTLARQALAVRQGGAA